MTLRVLLNQVANPGQAQAHRLENRVIGLERRFLGHVGDAGVVLDLQAAVVGLFHAAQNFEHRRFTRAVAANQADAFCCFEGKACVV